jgi:hypothetical protein
VVDEPAGGWEVISHTAAWRTPFPFGGLGYNGFAYCQLFRAEGRTLTTSTAVEE